MALNFQVDEATAAQRRFPLYLVDATDGITPETGEAAGQPQLSKNGAAFGNTSATLTAIGNGSYYVELTAGELDTLGMLTIRFKSANTAEFSLTGQVVSFDPYDATPPVDVTTWDGTAVATPNTAGVPLMDLVRIVGGLVPTPTTTGVPDVNVERWLDTLVTLGAGAPDVNVQSMDAASIASGVIAAAELTNIENEIWDALKSAHVVANSFGDFLDIEISSRSDFDETADPVELLDSGGAAGTSADELVDDIWNEDATGHQGAGSFGETVGDSAATGVTIHDRVNTNLDAAISSRSDFDETADPVELLDSGGAAGTSADELIDDVWDEAKAGHVGAGSMGEEIQSHALETVATETRLAELDAGNIPTDLSNIQSDTDDIQTRIPAALVGGAMDSDVSNIQTGVIDADAIAADAIGNSELATDAIGSDELAASAIQEISRAINPQVNNALPDITFEMYDSTTHNPSTGLTVTGERSLDGGAYGAVTGSIAEISDGTYQLDASAADMNGALIVFRFSEATADDTFVHVKTAA